MTTSKLRTLVWIACSLIVGCGGGATPAAKPVPRPEAYKDMNKEQRAAFMKEVVMPEMTTVFAAFDPKYAKMTCKTCHGDGVEDHTFKMPSAQLPVLPGTEEAFMEYAKDPEHARWSKFMAEQVEPKMASLLHVKAFDPATKSGELSCENCHTLKK